MNKLLVIFLLLLLAGCSEKSEPKTLKSIDIEKPGDTIDYSVLSTIGGQSNHGSIKGVGLNSLKLREVEYKESGSAIIKDKSIFYIDLKGALVSVNKNLNNENWRTTINSTSYYPPVIKDNRLYLLSLTGKIYIVDTVKGDILFEYELDSYPLSNLIIQDSSILVALKGGILMEVSDKGGVILNNSIPESGNWLFLDNRIYIAEKDRLVRVYNLDGTLNKTIESEVFNIRAISGGIGLLGISGDSYEIYDLESGTGLYREDGFNWTSIDSNEILLTKESGTIKLLSRTGFTKLWESNLGYNIIHKPLIIGESIVALGSKSLSVIDRISGLEESSYSLSNPPLYGPVVSSDFILLPTGDGFYILSGYEDRDYRKIYMELDKGIEYSLPLLNTGIILEFTPEESGDYNIFSSTMDSDPVEIEIVKEDGSRVGINIGYSSYEDGFVNRLDGKVTYYLHCRSLSKNIGDFLLEIK